MSNSELEDWLHEVPHNPEWEIDTWENEDGIFGCVVYETEEEWNEENNNNWPTVTKEYQKYRIETNEDGFKNIRVK